MIVYWPIQKRPATGRKTPVSEVELGQSSPAEDGDYPRQSFLAVVSYNLPLDTACHDPQHWMGPKFPRVQFMGSRWIANPQFANQVPSLKFQLTVRD